MSSTTEPQNEAQGHLWPNGEVTSQGDMLAKTLIGHHVGPAIITTARYWKPGRAGVLETIIVCKELPEYDRREFAYLSESQARQGHLEVLDVIKAALQDAGQDTTIYRTDAPIRELTL